MSTTLSDALTHLVTNWKSTAQALLTVGLTTTATLLPLGVLTPKQTMYAVIGQALCKAYVGLIQKD